MYTITTHHKGRCQVEEASTYREANLVVAAFLAMYRPSMFTYCTVRSHVTGMVTRVQMYPGVGIIPFPR